MVVLISGGVGVWMGRRYSVRPGVSVAWGTPVYGSEARMLSRHNFRRTYHGALAKLTNPATTGLRPTAARVLGALRDHGPLTADQLAAQLSRQGRTVTRATIDRALAELVAADAAAV